MARDYRQLLRTDGVWVPRWLVVTLLVVLALWFAARIFVPPRWVVQQLDAPDGTRSARLLRSVYLQHHFIVQLQEGWFWQTAYYSDRLPADFRVDLGERLRWSEDSQRVWLTLQGEPVWGFDFKQQRNLPATQLEPTNENEPARN